MFNDLERGSLFPQLIFSIGIEKLLIKSSKPWNKPTSSEINTKLQTFNWGKQTNK